MRILVTSSTGLTGKAVVKAMAEDIASYNDLLSAMKEYSIETLLKMFHHYNGGDFCGSPFITTAILKRTPTTFTEFLKKELK